ncbi:helix-turn-helix transcriptional regulator [Clostridium tagluense]|uniref:helix-turn-helix transcriptional regulator n=1 Tax=Clostridium TaxID=1485 RepID=UPI0013E91015|nr:MULTISPECIES: helix-turn-helix transcriptional regulator [Clostridium]MBU3128994.1 helix-turn-helix transcriptional regulator [Clostridium tagluense]MBW9158803.1 helix-turn-helix transcriptional regulator [Clostridium tagluense]MBZ9623266.1 helix-turn-helix transcriptional regulator [Clostridium sp. FP2]MBZ9634658.1 helix-turn-helix transcriptional regulator [Clostridium sp. FP1]MCB2312103.1 helix-turn-helix transcriptional regulator [Clostridium tagluense]
MKNMVFVRQRELKGMSQVKLASQLGICKDYVNMIENNRRMPGFSLAKRIADLFGITVDQLFFCSNSEQNLQ